MDWQQVVSLAIVAGTMALLIGREVRRRKGPLKGSCGGACHCAEKPEGKQTAEVTKNST